MKHFFRFLDISKCFTFKVMFSHLQTHPYSAFSFLHIRRIQFRGFWKVFRRLHFIHFFCYVVNQFSAWCYNEFFFSLIPTRVTRTIITTSPRWSGLHGRMARQQPLLSADHFNTYWRTLRLWEQYLLVLLHENLTVRPQFSMLYLEKNRHCSSPAQHHSYSEAWRWQHHAMDVFFYWRNWKLVIVESWTEQNRDILTSFL